jgi:heme A synthase
LLDGVVCGLNLCTVVYEKPLNRFYAAGAMGWMQVGLGIATLLLYVPVPVAASHQVLNLLLIAKICLFRIVVNLNVSGSILFNVWS